MTNAELIAAARSEADVLDMEEMQGTALLLRALAAELAETEATLANERGEGEPPSKRWAFRVEASGDAYWEHRARALRVTPHYKGARLGWLWLRRVAPGHYVGPAGQPAGTTARAAMRAADAAVREKP